MWSDRIVRDQVASPPSSLIPNLGMMHRESLHLCLLCFFSLLLFFLHCKEVLRSVLISLCAFAHCSQHDNEKWFVSLDLFAGRHKAKRHNIWRQSTVSGVSWHVILAAVSALPLVLSLPFPLLFLPFWLLCSLPSSPRGAEMQQQVQVGLFWLSDSSVMLPWQPK